MIIRDLGNCYIEDTLDKGKVIIKYYVSCYRRWLVLEVYKNDYMFIYKILDAAYELWREGIKKYVQYECCEEYMISQLKEKDLEYVWVNENDCTKVDEDEDSFELLFY